MVLVCLPSDALLQHLSSYLGPLTLGVGYLFKAAPAKHSCCSLPWMRGVSSPPPFLTFKWDGSSRPSCTHTATTPWMSGCSSWPPPLALGVGLLLLASAPGLGCRPWPLTWGTSSWPSPLTSDAGYLLSAVLSVSVAACA